MTAESVTNATSKAVATRDKGGGALVTQYAADFRQVLPSHMKPDQWLRITQAALKKGKKVKAPDGVMRTELEIAALTNPAVFCGHLLNAARLGLEPGTEQYYLTVRKEKGVPQILGIVGYQGYIELMYRAGAISSVVAECVYKNDSFRYRPGIEDRPIHEIDWDSSDRGALRLVYAYAVMKDGATSKVIVLNEEAITQIKESSTSAKSEYSPWTTHPASMWLKSAVRQLAKWVPTSAEYIREQLRAQRDVAAETVEQAAEHLMGPQPHVPDVSGLAEVPADDFDDSGAVLDAELVDDETAWAQDVQGGK